MIKGFIMYQGASVLVPEKEIVVIATLKTSNAKTGNMVQTWILSTKRNPVETSYDKADDAICGNCPHKHSVGGACYVNLGHAPLAVYNGFKRGIYPVYNESEHKHLLENRFIRLGSYGDPAAVPFEVMHYLSDIGIGHTGYTHQIKHKNFDHRYTGICMISAERRKQAENYQDNDYSTFRIITNVDDMIDGEIQCLSDSKGMNCIDCGLCAGAGSNNIVVQVHGSRSKRFLNNAKVA